MVLFALFGSLKKDRIMKKEQLNVNQIPAEKLAAKRFYELERLNNKLKMIYTKAELERAALQGEFNNKSLPSYARKVLVEQAVKKYGLSVRKACQLFNISRTAFYYENTRPSTDPAEQRLLELANQYPTYGYWKYYSLLRYEGYIINHKKVYRIYKQSIQCTRHAMSLD